MPDSSVSRRTFLGTAGTAALGAMVVPRSVLGGPRHTAPSDQLAIAIVGAGGMGASNGLELVSQRIVAFCDVDFAQVERALDERLTVGSGENRRPREEGLALKAQYDDARRYTDFREMLARERDLDGVVIATPDHTHAVIARAAMEAGKHVYVQKPLTWSIHEARVLTRLAEETGVVTQMGNQGHSSDDARRVNEIVRSGVLGPIRDVKIWTDRPYWPQGIPRPAPRDLDGDDERGWWPADFQARLAEGVWSEAAMPETLDWDLWLGPVAEDIPWHPMYTPFHWRGQVEFGGGALGDMGAHLVDHPWWALELGYPTTVEATSTRWGGGGSDTPPAMFPLATKVHYDFPRRGVLPPVTLEWLDGGMMPRRDPRIPPEVILDRGGGVMYVGERGVLLHETYGSNPRIYPETVAREAAEVPMSYNRTGRSHEMNWVDACKGLDQAVSPFSYAGPLTEVMHLGTVALRTGPGIPIEFDPVAMRITNHEDANRYLTREYRPGWEV